MVKQTVKPTVLHTDGQIFTSDALFFVPNYPPVHRLLREARARSRNCKAAAQASVAAVARPSQALGVDHQRYGPFWPSKMVKKTIQNLQIWSKHDLTIFNTYRIWGFFLPEKNGTWLDQTKHLKIKISDIIEISGGSEGVFSMRWDVEVEWWWSQVIAINLPWIFSSS